MDYFSPALREIGRLLHRGALRLALWRARRSLARSETALGLLGWQQADFDAEPQRQVDEINNVEREQGRLINEAAERAMEIRRLWSELEAVHRDHEEKKRQLLQEERRAREPMEEVQRRLADRRKTEPNFERRIPELDRELREVTKLLSELLRADNQTVKIRHEIVRLRERTVSIPNEKNDLRTQHFRAVTEIRTLEEDLAQREKALAEREGEREALEAAWATEEKELSARLKDEEKEKARLEKRIAELETAKANPYRRIGRALADAGVPPMNQPQALERVIALDAKLTELARQDAASRAASAAEDRRPLQISYAIWAVILALAVWLVARAASG